MSRSTCALTGESANGVGVGKLLLLVYNGGSKPITKTGCGRDGDAAVSCFSVMPRTKCSPVAEVKRGSVAASIIKHSSRLKGLRPGQRPRSYITCDPNKVHWPI